MTLFVYAVAALAEIAGCFAVWSVVRYGADRIWLVPGLASLALFAWLLTKADAEFAGRAYAAYGGIYIVASLVWLWTAEQRMPDRWDLMGALVSVAGTLIILFAPRGP